MQSHQMKRAAGNSAPTDPDFKQVTLLLHGDGTNGGQNNTFIDGSTNNFTITRNGNVAQGTFSPYSQPDGRWSNYFDGDGDKISAASNAAFVMGSGDFTVEAWCYQTGKTDPYPRLIHFGPFWLSNDAWGVCPRDNDYPTKITFISYKLGGRVLVSSSDFKLNAWNHVVVTRASGVFRLFVNGILEATNSSFVGTSIESSSTNSVCVGSAIDNSNEEDFAGYISNVRVVKGAVVSSYSTSSTTIGASIFTPPVSPLTAITNTSLLTCQSNRIVDNSSNAFAITKNGNVAVTPFSSFAPTDIYAASTNGGSAGFVANPDYLVATSSTAFDIGTSDFTIEAWIYLKGLMSGYAMIAGTDGVNNYFAVRTTEVIMFNGTTEIRGAATINLDQWNHIVWQVSGGNAQMYCNGTRVYNAAYGTFTTNQTAMTVGRSLSYANYYTEGYISNFRVVIGSAVYSGTTITVPTAPLTAVTNTKLLLNCINGAVVDNAAKNDIETVGNAQVSTTQAKFGTGSLYFDGTGDWLVIRDQPYLRFGTGNFTIEFWVYLASGDTGSNRGLVAKGGASTGWLVSLNTTQKVVFTYTTSTITSTGSITTNAWNHIAVVREGTGTNQTKIYIGGSNDGTGTVSTDFTQTESMYVGADRSAASPMKGYIDDVRITTGVARYTANFTPPTRAFPDK